MSTPVTLPRKALSIRQPWAWAILHAGKDVENRDWSTRFRGKVAIHAAKGCTEEEFYQFHAFYRSIRLSPARGHLPALPELPPLRDLARGAIVGVVEIVDCVRSRTSPWFMGEYGFVLANAVALPEPIPCRGALGFWDIPTEWRKVAQA